MLRLSPFKAWRPAPDLVSQVAAVPYDVVDHSEAIALAKDNPYSFLRISRSEIELPAATDPYAPGVYERAKKNFKDRCQDGTFMQDAAPSFYLYRLQQGAHIQDGIMACSNVDDYSADVIKKHEKTRHEKEIDRTRHIDTLNAHTGPVLLTYRDVPAINELMRQTVKDTPLYSFTAPDNITHVIWTIPATESVRETMSKIPLAYIADGHHRAASSVNVAAKRRAAGGSETEEYNWFLTLLYPAGNLKVLAYNRIVKDLNGLTPEALLAAAGTAFELTENACPQPTQPGQISMYLKGRWFGLRRRAIPKNDPIAALDVSALQNQLLAPVLGIQDPRTDQRIDFIGGARGTEALTKAVDTGAAAVAFSMYPVTVEQLMAIADKGLTMPPKSTWFDPKPRSGLLIHSF